MTAENIRKFNEEYGKVYRQLLEEELTDEERICAETQLLAMKKTAILLGGKIVPCPCCEQPTLEIDGLTACSDDPKLQQIYDGLKKLKEEK